MQTIITLNTIGLIILFVICSLFLILLLNAYKHIAKLEDEKAEAIRLYKEECSKILFEVKK